MRRLWIYGVCKSLLLSPVAVKELKLFPDLQWKFGRISDMFSSNSFQWVSYPRQCNWICFSPSTTKSCNGLQNMHSLSWRGVLLYLSVSNANLRLLTFVKQTLCSVQNWIKVLHAEFILKWGLFVSLRKHAYSNILKISPPKTESFQIKNLTFFTFLLKT